MCAAAKAVDKAATQDYAMAFPCAAAKAVDKVFNPIELAVLECAAAKAVDKTLKFNQLIRLIVCRREGG